MTSILTFLAEEMQKSGFLVIYYNIFGEFVLLKIGSSEHLKQSRHIVHDLSFCHIISLQQVVGLSKQKMFCRERESAV